MITYPEDHNFVSFLASTVEGIRDDAVTIRAEIATMATKGDLARMATNDDLAQLESRLVEKIEVETTVIRGDIKQVHLRLDSIERALLASVSTMDTAVRLLRSDIYY